MMHCSGKLTELCAQRKATAKNASSESKETDKKEGDNTANGETKKGASESKSNDTNDTVSLIASLPIRTMFAKNAASNQHNVGET